MSTWIGSITDEEIARKASSSGLIGDTNLGMVDANLSTVAVAQATAITNTAALQICDRPIGDQCSRGFKVASNMGATFGSTFTAFYASLPSNGGHKRRMITG